MKTILYVDDNEDMIELVKLVLSKSGYKLITLSKPGAAEEFCIAKQPDLVLLDLNMPRINGFEITRKLREKNFTKPIVVFTASGSDRDKEKAFSAGCDDYIVKDMEMKSLERAVDTYLADAGGI